MGKTIRNDEDFEGRSPDRELRRRQATRREQRQNKAYTEPRPEQPGQYPTRPA